MATKADDDLGGFLMAMDRHHCAGLHGVELALGVVGFRVTEVIIHPQAWRRLCLGSEIIKKFVVDYHIKRC